MQGGQVTGEGSCGDENERRRRENYFVTRLDSIEQARSKAREREGRGQSGPNANQNELSGLLQHKPLHVARSCAERHPDTEFASALRDTIRHHAVESDDGEHERERGNDGRSFYWWR